MIKIVLFFIFSIVLYSTELKIASYNVENLFDMHRDGTEYQEYIPYRHNWTPSILDKKLTNISEVLCDIDADIVGLQEIEKKNALKLLQNSLKRYGCPYRYSAITQKKGSSIQLALLSKIPIQSYRDIIVKRVLGQRNILEVKFMIDSHPLYIFVNHWNSKKSPESKRIISANALKKRLLALPKDSEYILLGDFNSNYNEYRKIRKTGINHILSTIEDDRLLRECDIKPNRNQHYNLWLELPIYKRWSYSFYGQKEGLDAMLLPYNMFDGEGLDYVDNSFYAFKQKYLFTKRGFVFRWEYKRNRHTGRGYSDHMAVVATFSTKPYIKRNCRVKLATIKELYQKNIAFPILLKEVKIIHKEKNMVIIQQKITKETIPIYGLDDILELGKRYDITVFKRKLYKNRYEIVDFRVEKRYDSI